MRVVDLHCDTLYKHVTGRLPLDDSRHEVQLCREPDAHKLQCYAIWLPDSYTGEQAEQTVQLAAQRLQAECERLHICLLKPGEPVRAAFEHHQNTAYLTIENGLALDHKTENVARFAALGVRMMTLTWNAQNPIGDGADVTDAKGLTAFGKEVTGEMERHGMIVDISHASQRLFFDVAEHTRMPLVASHSNAFAVTPHRRNLTDEQIRIIRERGGLIGLNFHNAFLNAQPQQACIEDILRHTEHFLSLGCGDCLCFGSDFDGGVLPSDIKNSLVYDRIAEIMLHHHYDDGVIRKIFYDNALNFFENFDNPRIMV